MDFFDDSDPFDSIVREFFGESPRRKQYKEKIIENESEDRVIDFLESGDKVYLIFELPGYDEKDVLISIKDRKIEIIAKKKSEDNMQDYLSKKLNQGIKIKKTLPNFVNAKKFFHSFRNGILEVIFESEK